MGKLIFWAIVILAVLLVARILARQHDKQASAPRADSLPRRGAAPPVDQPESMVRCAHCGIHMPRSEALLINGETWCSSEHAKLGQRR
ncbi:MULTISPECIES: PP0621 family protein [Pusillimonas]|uniref:PP0621 family protein n=1 Tax=Pusillimonas TaxID=305976 RepID=UPI0014316747|nr:MULTISPECIES: PP0621 family protein [Pusillimonas]MDX3896222.1 PP0621 family protein [Pusillimonas sp.]